MNYKKTVFVGDLHVPYHDTIALNAFKKFCRWYKPDELVFIGDILDFYAISHFVKDPYRSLELQSEVDEANIILDDIIKVVKPKKIYFLYGNHERRLQKYLWSRAYELAGLRDIEVSVMLKFKSRNIVGVENGRMRYKGLLIKHGSVVRKYSGYTAKAEFDKNGMSGVSGHTHRLATYYQTNDGGEYTWLENGCLCRFDAEYLEGEQPNWQHGFSIGTFKNDSRRFHLQNIPIVSGKAMFGDMEFDGNTE